MPAALQPRVRNLFLRGLVGIAFILGLGVACQLIAFAAEDLYPIAKAILPAVNSLALLPGVMLGYCLFVRLIERRPLSELAPRPALPQLSMGLALGVALFMATMAPLIGLGLYTVNGTNPAQVLVKPLVIGLVAAVAEELVFRGLLLRLLEERWGSLWALGISSLVFGLAHGINPGASPIIFLIIALEAGLLLGAAWLATRRLWLGIGLHFAWNFTQGGIFGAAVSGTGMAGLLAGRLTGPAVLTGGPFGPEASLQAVAICVTAGLFLLLLARRHGKLVGPARPPVRGQASIQ